MASAAQVFAIAELLEMILLRLPEYDLLSLRVSTKWRNFIETSPQIQQKLFYKTKAGDPASTSDIIYNPLLAIALTACAKSTIMRTEKESTRASWNGGIFLTQPATSEVRVCVGAFYPDFTREDEQPIDAEIPPYQERKIGTIENPNGVTIDDVWSTEWIWRRIVRASRSGHKEALVRFCVSNTTGRRWDEWLEISLPSA